MNELVTGGYAFEMWLGDDDEAAVQVALDGALAEAPVHVMTEVHDGVAMLRGTVPSFADRLAARETAMSVPGIWQIDDGIEVEPQQFEQPFIINDAILRYMITVALTWDSRVRGGVTVAVANGCVTLGGTVGTDAERAAVLEVVARLRGVRDVTNEIAILPVPQPVDAIQRVREAIDHALGREARHVHVQLMDGVVELKGTVHTLAQRRAAERAVCRVMGDVPLENHLSVKH